MGTNLGVGCEHVEVGRVGHGEVVVVVLGLSTRGKNTHHLLRAIGERIWPTSFLHITNICLIDQLEINNKKPQWRVCPRSLPLVQPATRVLSLASAHPGVSIDISISIRIINDQLLSLASAHPVQIPFNSSYGEMSPIASIIFCLDLLRSHLYSHWSRISSPHVGLFAPTDCSSPPCKHLNVNIDGYKYW